MDLSQWHNTSPAAPASSGSVTNIDLKTLHRMEKMEKLFVDTSGSPDISSCGMNSSAAGTTGISLAAASRAAAAKFGYSSSGRAGASGRINTTVVSGSSSNGGEFQAAGNAAQVAARQRRASVTMPDSVTQDDILARQVVFLYSINDHLDRHISTYDNKALRYYDIKKGYVSAGNRVFDAFSLLCCQAGSLG